MSIRDSDVAVEGDAVRVIAPKALARIAKAWADQGWPAEPDESGKGITVAFNAPSRGPPWNVYPHPATFGDRGPVVGARRPNPPPR